MAWTASQSGRRPVTRRQETTTDKENEVQQQDRLATRSIFKCWHLSLDHSTFQKLAHHCAALCSLEKVTHIAGLSRMSMCRGLVLLWMVRVCSTSPRSRLASATMSSTSTVCTNLQLYMRVAARPGLLVVSHVLDLQI
jgi:hypothetical protein